VVAVQVRVWCELIVPTSYPLSDSVLRGLHTNNPDTDKEVRLQSVASPLQEWPVIGQGHAMECNLHSVLLSTVYSLIAPLFSVFPRYRQILVQLHNISILVHRR
jgi:hypothetical protein